MLLRGMPDEDIMAIAECDKQFIDEIKDEIFSTKR
jgi:hypothetical protein